MSVSRLLIVVGFILGIILGGVAGYLSVDIVPPPTPAAPAVTKQEAPPTVPQAADEGDYGPDWPVCRDMSNNPLIRFKACDNVLAKGGLTPQHQSWALNNRGTANLGMSNVDAAVKDFASALKINPKNAAPYLNLANLARSEGNLPDALALTDKALALGPSEPGYCTRAAILRDLGRIEEGLAAIDAATKQGLLADCAKLVHADLLEKKGQTEKALLALTDVGENDQTASRAACQRARLKVGEGKLREAFELYAEGMRLDPGNNCAALNAALYAPYAMEFDKALAFVKGTMATHPKLHLLNCYLGRIYEMQGETRKALTAYNDAIELAPETACGLVQRAEYWSKAGDLKAALQDYDAAGRLSPDRPDVWKGRAEVLAQLGRNQEALASYDRVLAQEPEDVQALEARGDLRIALQFYPQAVADFQKLQQLEPEMTYAHYRAALASFASNSPKAAVEACAKLPAKDDWEESCLLLSAEAMLMGGDLDAALAKLKQLPSQSAIGRQSQLFEAGALLMNGEIDAAKAIVEAYRTAYPDQLYGAVWSVLVAQAANTPIPADVAALADVRDVWPTPVLHWLVRGGEAADLLSAADTPDPRLSLQRTGEAEFYLGLGAMLAGAEKAADAHFAKAARLGYAEQDKDAYPAAYSFSNAREFALAAWAATSRH